LFGIFFILLAPPCRQSLEGDGFRLHNNMGFILLLVGFILLLRQIASCLSLPIGRPFIPKNVYSRQIRKGVEPIRLTPE
jgi:hypothetical protein